MYLFYNIIKMYKYKSLIYNTEYIIKNIYNIYIYLYIDSIYIYI